MPQSIAYGKGKDEGKEKDGKGQGRENKGEKRERKMKKREKAVREGRGKGGT